MRRIRTQHEASYTPDLDARTGAHVSGDPGELDAGSPVTHQVLHRAHRHLLNDVRHRHRRHRVPDRTTLRAAGRPGDDDLVQPERFLRQREVPDHGLTGGDRDLHHHGTIADPLGRELGRARGDIQQQVASVLLTERTDTGTGDEHLYRGQRLTGPLVDHPSGHLLSTKLRRDQQDGQHNRADKTRSRSHNSSPVSQQYRRTRDSSIIR